MFRQSVAYVNLGDWLTLRANLLSVIWVYVNYFDKQSVRSSDITVEIKCDRSGVMIFEKRGFRYDVTTNSVDVILL